MISQKPRSEVNIVCIYICNMYIYVYISCLAVCSCSLPTRRLCLLQTRHDGYGMVWVKTQRAGISDIHNVNPTINLQHRGYIDDSSLC